MHLLQTSGATPLFIASQNGHVECVRVLLSNGAAINQAMVGCGWGSVACTAPTPLGRQFVCCGALSERFWCESVLQTDGAAPLFIASQKGHVDCVLALLGGGAAIDQAEVGCLLLIECSDAIGDIMWLRLWMGGV